jgi:hypothetical protein
MAACDYDIHAKPVLVFLVSVRSRSAVHIVSRMPTRSACRTREAVSDDEFFDVTGHWRVPMTSRELRPALGGVLSDENRVTATATDPESVARRSPGCSPSRGPR